jgi:hypothetical protein
LKDVDIDGTIILKLVLKDEDKMVWTGFMWLTIGANEGLL